MGKAERRQRGVGMIIGHDVSSSRGHHYRNHQGQEQIRYSNGSVRTEGNKEGNRKVHTPSLGDDVYECVKDRVRERLFDLCC